MSEIVSETWDRYKPRDRDRESFDHFYDTRSSIGLVERPKVKANFEGHEFYIRFNPKYYLESFTYKKKAFEEYKEFKRQGVKFPKFEEKHKNFYFNFEGDSYNANLRKYARHILLLKNNIRIGKIVNFCEIGSGYGGLTEMLILNTGIKNYYLIDIPETLGIAKVWLSKYDNVKFISTEEFEQVCDASFPSIDLFFNSNSFGEMTKAQIKEYFDWIQTFNNCYLFSSNRLERREGNELIRALDYPYDKEWITTFEQQIGDIKNPLHERLSMRGFSDA